jgi:hypothetical protein
LPYIPAPDDDDDDDDDDDKDNYSDENEAADGVKLERKPKYSEETYTSVILSTKPALPEPEMNPGHHGGKPATNSQHFGTASTIS